MDQSWLGVAVGTSALVIAAIAVFAHYRRERRRAEFLRKLDRSKRAAHTDSSGNPNNMH